MKPKKSYNIFKVLKRMLRHMKEKDSAQFGRVAVYTLIAAVYPFFAVFLPKIAIGILEQGGEEAVRNLLLCMAGYFLVAGVFSIVKSYLQNMIVARNMRVRINYLAELSNRLMQIDYCHHEDASFFEKYQKGMNAGNSNNNGIEGIYTRLSEFGAKVVTLIGMVILAGALSPVLLLALLLHTVVIIAAQKLTHDYEYSQKEARSKAYRRMTYYQKTSQDFSYGKDIRIFNLRDRVMDNYEKEIGAHIAMYRKVKNREFILGFMGLATLLLSNVLMYGILIRNVVNGMPISSFSMYITLTMTLMSLLLDVGDDIAFIWNEGEYVDDFYKLLDAPLLTEGKKTAEEVLGEKKTLEVKFDHVWFRYPGTEKDILKDFSFTIHAGERLAIVGINGAGKSTIVKLMTGLFAPTKGHIYLNGTDIQEMEKRELYQLFSAVFQEVNILPFPIRDNVTCGAENPSEDRVRAALDKVGLLKKAEGFEHGLDQMLLKVIDENGTDLSGGERQKLSIARGLYKDAPMVIMDEPTAALDALAEAEIYENFSSLVKGKTAVYISHRLASTRFCDKIALFDETGLAEYGNHEELMEKKGKYYEMFTVQGKYYQEVA